MGEDQFWMVALVQGVTEFLPISSSAHLLTLRTVFGWDYPAQIIHVSAHLGTLLAVLLYCRDDVAALLRGTTSLLTGGRDGSSRFTLLILMATLPLIAIGLLESRYSFLPRDNLSIIAWSSIGFGILLWLSDKFFSTIRRIEHMTMVGAFLIGAVQVLALIPGTSRAGAAMMAGRWLGLERDETARFSLLLSIPAIAGASLLAGIELVQIGDIALLREAIIVTFISALCALPIIAMMMAWLRRSGFGLFALYRIAFGVWILLYLP